MTELELARRISQNDEEALEALVERHYAAIYRFVRRLAGGHDEAARELTQEALLQIRDAAHGFKGRSQLRTWMLRIAYRTYTRYRRSLRTEPLRDSIADPGNGVSTLDRLAFEQALREISPKLREAFALHELSELSVEETAEVLGIPLGTAKARIARARHALIRKLQSCEAINYVAPAIEVRNSP